MAIPLIVSPFITLYVTDSTLGSLGSTIFIPGFRTAFSVRLGFSASTFSTPFLVPPPSLHSVSPFSTTCADNVPLDSMSAIAPAMSALFPPHFPFSQSTRFHATRTPLPITLADATFSTISLTNSPSSHTLSRYSMASCSDRSPSRASCRTSSPFIFPSPFITIRKIKPILFYFAIVQLLHHRLRIIRTPLPDGKRPLPAH